jgi:aspartate/methionine/tyrosine aminotransferase
VQESEVLPLLGTTHALFTAYASLVSAGDEVLVENPSYEPMYRIAEGLGARVTRFERPGPSCTLDPDRVFAAMTPQTKVIALTNLHNPSGVRASDEAFREIASHAEKQGAYVLIDEVYAPFDVMCDESGRWAGSARHLAPNIVAVASLTKVYGLGAFRIGWMVGLPELIARGESVLLSNVGHAPLAWAAFGVRAFDCLPLLAARARRHVGGKRARVEAWVAAHPHLVWSAPREGLFGLATDTRGGDLTGRLERAAIDAGVLVAPGAFFGVPNGFRLSWSIAEDRLGGGLDRLAVALG